MAECVRPGLVLVRHAKLDHWAESGCVSVCVCVVVRQNFFLYMGVRMKNGHQIDPTCVLYKKKNFWCTSSAFRISTYSHKGRGQNHHRDQFQFKTPTPHPTSVFEDGKHKDTGPFGRVSGTISFPAVQLDSGYR